MATKTRASSHRRLPATGPSGHTASGNSLSTTSQRTPQLGQQAALGSYQKPSRTHGILKVFSFRRTPAEIMDAVSASGGLTPYQSLVLMDDGPGPLVLGPYVLEAELGQGRWGNTFAATRLSSGGLASVHCLPPTFDGELAALRSIVKQTRAIDSNRFPKTQDCNVGNGRLYIASEYLPGEDLESLVSRTGPLAAQLAVSCTAKVVEGLAAALRAGLTHHELRPSKILVNHRGNISIRDLALANLISRRKSKLSDPYRLTQILPKDHLDYCAPELLAGDLRRSFQADVYSLGCILFYLLLGRPIFPGKDPMQAVTAHRESAVPSVCELNRQLPTKLDRCLQRMLAKNPADRFESYGRLHAELKSVYRALPSPPPAAGERWAMVREAQLATAGSRPAIRRVHVLRSLGISVAGFGLAGVLTAGGISIWPSGSATTQPPAASPTGASHSIDSVDPKLDAPDEPTLEIPVIESEDMFQLR